VRVDFEKPHWAKDKYYLGDQLVAYPKIATIPPKGKVQVKIAPRIKNELDDGEYVAVLMFKELQSQNNKGQVSMLMNIGVPYYGRKGKLKTGVYFENIRLEKTTDGYELLGKAENTGNFSYSLNVNLKFYKNKKLIKEESFKQGFYRDNLVELKKSIQMNTESDHAEVIFENIKFNFSKGFRFDF
jgi:P pilus assembly chaperone PapD